MNLCLLVSLLLSVAQGSDDRTRGIGQYPGAPDEFFAPTVTWTENSQSLSNVALHRTALASSTYDYNHTAHLVTDGICDDRLPAMLQASTPKGLLPRREAEWSIDGGPYSRNILLGGHTWMQYDWNGELMLTARRVRLEGMVAYDDGKAKNGFSIRCLTSDDGTHWQEAGKVVGKGLPGTPLHYKLHSDPNKQEDAELLPARVLNETVTLLLPIHTKHFRLQLDMDGAAHWDIREIHFIDAEGNERDVLPSNTFSSMWMSNGGGEQWIYTDLGRRLPIEEVRLHWYQAPRKGAVEVSDNARDWMKAADLQNDTLIRMKTTARYVRLLLQEPGDAGYYALREMKVMSPATKCYTPHAVAGWREGRYELSGGNWQLQRSSEVTATGEQIATPDYDSRSWIAATVPGTVLASYINIGAVPNPNFADDVDQISESFFRSNFWYRDTFEVPAELCDGRLQWLCFDGINWKAMVYLNGVQLGRIDGAFMRGKFNVTGLLKKGTNCLAVKIICNDHFAAIKEKDEQTTQFNGGLLGADNPTFHATVGWDWITTVRGREAGIWNEVYLTTTGTADVSDPYVKTELSADGKTVSITPSVFVKNNDNLPTTGTLRGWIGNTQFEQTVTLPANSEREVVFHPSQYPQLTGGDFRLWWPNGYGEPYLYDAGFTFTPDASVPTTIHYQAGLREMKYVDAKDSLRLFINGRRLVPLGGNWGFDEHNLLYRAREYDIAVGYHRDMNFNMIRNWVGQVGDEAFYEACDRHGIMIWQDFWLANPADGPDPYDNVLFLRNAEDYVRRIRSHASIALYCGRNEGFPPEAIDRKLREYVHTLSSVMDYISHSSSEGVSGGGPYRALPMKEYFSRQSGKIHSERGMPNVMNIESMRRTMSPDALWPQSVEWGQHDFTLMGAQRASEFNRLVSEGFGEAQSAEEFCRWAQLINYNGYRGMFESTSKSRAGLLLWMSHPCWPSMVWQTYDYYFEPTGAYFGAKKACEPLHIQYNALTDSIEVVNHSFGRTAGITVSASVFNLDGKRVHHRKARVTSEDDSTLSWLKLAELMPSAPSDVWFLRLQIADKKGGISENLYIMGREENNYRKLATLPKAEIVKQTTMTTTGNTRTALVTLRNKSNVPAPFLRLNLMGADGEQILPVVYSDNYITLMPGESRSVRVTWKIEDARGMKEEVEVTSFEVGRRN